MTDLSPLHRLAQPHPVRAPRGSQLHCANWLIEAAWRMIQNNLDPEVAENPDALVVYGGIGKAARNWDCFEAILTSLRQLKPDETLLVQSGKPVGVFRTHADAPRVLIANSNLVPKWATWEHFDELDRKGLMMYGQMTAGSWIYIGSQGIVQGTYETFVEAGRQHYGGNLAGRWILTAGLGGMGGAQPLAASFAGACSLNIECQQSRIDFRLRSRYLDEQATSLDDALARIAKYTAAKKAVSIGLLGNAAEILPELVQRGRSGQIRPDLVTDQTSAHDLVNGYLPAGWSVERWRDAQADSSQHAALREAGVPIAIATDHNPGSSPCLSLLLMLNMACTLFRLTPEEAWRGVTTHAARALGLHDHGMLAAGQRADFVVWDAGHPREIAYRFGHNPCRRVVRGGVQRMQS